MSFALATLALPVLLGYTLYAGIADRLSLSRPTDLSARPRWVLGLGTGLSIAAVIVTTLVMTTGASLQGALALLPGAGLALAACLSATLVATSLARGAQRRTRLAAIDTEATTVAIEDRLPETDPFDLDVAKVTIETAELHIEADIEADIDADEAIDGPGADATGGIVFGLESAIPTLSAVEPDLRQELDQERALRERTETHLRITRKALSVLEGEARALENHAEARTELEARVEGSVREVAAAEASAERESFARIAAETTVVEQREDLVRAQRDVRKHVEARARALAAASKSLAHARQSARRRVRLERDLDEARATISNRQETISSLIKALEKEKRRTGEEVASLAKQLVLHERQLKARRSLEEVARSVEGKLGSRLVKKVAKARPLVGAG